MFKKICVMVLALVFLVVGGAFAEVRCTKHDWSGEIVCKDNQGYEVRGKKHDWSGETTWRDNRGGVVREHTDSITGDTVYKRDNNNFALPPLPSGIPAPLDNPFNRKPW